MNLYFNGESLRHVADSMKLFGVKVTHQTIHNWIKKYIGMMDNYLASITPQVSEKWYCDEIYLKIKGDKNTNKMERLNGEIRDREKVMRSLKTDDSRIIKGMQIHHNYIRSHMGIDGMTPSEKAGIKVEGLNKWITIIQNAKLSQ